ncbi:hypothetical protein D3C85_1487400 [compost metagenome]
MIELATKHQKTILVSSHLLSEIERVATHVGIINKGKLLFQGTINELHDLSKPMIELEIDDIVKAQAFLEKNGYQILGMTDKKMTLPFVSTEECGKLNTLLVQQGLTVYSIYQIRKDLEHLFLDITKSN